MNFIPDFLWCISKILAIHFCLITLYLVSLLEHSCHSQPSSQCIYLNRLSLLLVLLIHKIPSLSSKLTIVILVDMFFNDVQIHKTFIIILISIHFSFDYHLPSLPRWSYRNWRKKNYGGLRNHEQSDVYLSNTLSLSVEYWFFILLILRQLHMNTILISLWMPVNSEISF